MTKMTKMTNEGTVVHSSSYKVDGKAWADYMPWLKFD